MRQLQWLLAVWAVLAAAVGWAQEPGHPLVAPAPGAEMVEHGFDPAATYPLIVAPVDEAGGIDANLPATLTLDGELTRLLLQAPAPPGEILAHHRTSLKKQDFEILYQCKNAACGAAFAAAAPGRRAFPRRFAAAGGGYYLAARLNRGIHDVYVSVHSVAQDGGALTRVDVVEVQPRQLAALTITAEQLARQLQESGRVALYGIYFDTESARLQPASKPTLREIARLLENKPDLRLLVVGHTDTRGGFEYNIELSRRRAHSVVEALASDYGVSRARLKPWGVGFTSPAASNATPEGRASNRRVELVVW